ncbi:MAG TPA: glycosyltransferase N-terminal domain-containing protein [Puia sp.]|nr:glycosyltransferase N-terminal domain-containing protein [Puia sp.]
MSIILYHVFLLLYRMGVRCIAPWNRKAKLWLDGRRELFDQMRAEIGHAPTAEESKRSEGKAVVPVIWMHCASLGEFEQGRPVLEALRRERPDCRIVLSFFSPSGYMAKKDYAGADHIFYLPLDGPRNARTFIDLVRPSLVLWVKYDYWYYFLVELKKRRIPVLLVSGVFRADQPFFRWYGRLHRYMLECFTHLFVQTETSRELLAKLHYSHQVSVSGDTRFDRVITIAQGGEPVPSIAAFCGSRPVVVAGSTWAEDEEELDHFANTHPEIRFILAPHEIAEDRLREVERLFRHAVRYSVWQSEGRKPAGPTAVGGWPEPNVLIIDNIGMLSQLYRYATITYIGGGFGDDGVHNVLEAAVYGKPVVFGPVIEKYIEAVELVESGGGLIIDSALEAEKVFNRLLANTEECREIGAAAEAYVFSRKGATDRIINYIQENRLLTS